MRDDAAPGPMTQASAPTAPGRLAREDARILGAAHSKAALAKDVHDERDLHQQVAREQARVAQALRDATASGGVDVDTGYRGGIRLRTLRDEPPDDPRQHVAAAAPRERRNLVRGLARAAVG